MRTLNLSNALALAAIFGFAVAGWVPGLLGLLCVFVLVTMFDVEALRQDMRRVVVAVETDPLPLAEGEVRH